MKYLVSLIILCIAFQTPVFSQFDSSREMNLIHHLKSKLIGKKVVAMLEGKVRPIKLKVVNIVYEEEYYYCQLSNGDYLPINFQVNAMAPLFNFDSSKKNNQLRVNVLKSQEIINQSIQKTFSDSSNSTESSSLKNIEDNIDDIFSKNYFTTSEEINYTNSISSKENEINKDFFVITSKGLYLKNGRKIKTIIGINAIEGKSIGTNK